MAVLACGVAQAQSSGVQTVTLEGSGADKALMVAGFQLDYDRGVPDTAVNAGPLGWYTTDDLCAASDQIGWALETIVNVGEQAAIQSDFPVTLGYAESLPGAPRREDIKESVRNARDNFCDRERGSVSTYPFAITYAYCRMTMITNAHVLDIQLSTAGGSGKMAMADLVRGEGAQLSLRQRMGQVKQVLGSGWSSDISMTSPADGGEISGYPTTRYQFKYSGGPGTGIGLGGALQNSIRVDNYGWVWVSSEAPGIDIVRDFYQNLTNEVSSGGSMSFFEGLVKSLVGMLSEGLPLRNIQSTDASILNRFQGNRKEIEMKGGSSMLVTDLALVDMSPGWCTSSIFPADFPLTDIDQQVSEALSGVDSAEMQEAMQQYNEAMQSMTPEQQQMMEQMGMGNMMEQMMGGGMPGAQPPTANPRDTKGSPGSNTPSSKDLQGGSITESVQKHLQALGYDVGEVNGEMSMETTIAISTFQAEKGMEVTGEVSPQLLGVLSAEVDSRR